MEIELSRYQRQLRGEFDPLFLGLGYQFVAVRADQHAWRKDLGWAVLSVGVNTHKYSAAESPSIVGGAGVFLRKIHPIIQPEYKKNMAPGDDFLPTIGGPIEWIDARIAPSDCQFSSEIEFRDRLPKIRRAVEESVLPELERFSSEDELLRILRDPDWRSLTRLPATPDRRAAIVCVLLFWHERAASAIAWGREALEEIRSRDSGKKVEQIATTWAASRDIGIAIRPSAEGRSRELEDVLTRLTSGNLPPSRNE